MMGEVEGWYGGQWNIKIQEVHQYFLTFKEDEA